MPSNLTTTNYVIRAARGDDLPFLAALERAAASLFREAGIDGELLEGTVPTRDLEQGAKEGRLWVAAAANDEPVGFAFATLRAGQPHLEELDVHPEHGRRGLGSELLRAVIAWAAALGKPWLSLSTFSDVPWNAPFYARFGFQPIPASELPPALAELVAIERDRGLPMERRVILRLALGAAERPPLPR